MNNLEPGRTLEVNSLSLQGTKPLEVLYSPEVTARMLNNAEQSLRLLQEEFPSVDCGLSLHAGEVIDINQVAESDLKVTSIDVPDIAYPSEFLEKVKERPDQIISHVAWRLNSVLGFNAENAQSRLSDKLLESKKLQPFETMPLIRTSARRDQNTGKPDEKAIANLYSTFEEKGANVKPRIAVEYNAEEMSVQEYIDFVKHLNVGNRNIGFSMDLAHIFEYFKIIQQRNSSEARIATMDLYQNLINANPSLFFSLDVNNISDSANNFGETHKGILDQNGYLPVSAALAEYRRYLDRYNMAGRISIEPSPRDNQLMLTKEGMGYLFYQISPFSPSTPIH